MQVGDSKVGKFHLGQRKLSRAL